MSVTVNEIAEKCGAEAGNLISAVRLGGDPGEVLSSLPALCDESNLRYADELRTICRVLSEMGFADEIEIDFSIVNDMDYYNGVVFRGYVDGVPEGVLSGGCYDRMMKKTGRDCGAVGFAVYLDRLERIATAVSRCDEDVLLLYSADTAPETVLTAVTDLIKDGKTVRASFDGLDPSRFQTVFTLSGDGTLVKREEGQPC